MNSTEGFLMTISQKGYFSKKDSLVEAADHYREEGYVVVRDALHPDEVTRLKDEAVAVCRQERGPLRTSFAHPGAADQLPGPAALTAMSADEAIAHFLCIHQAHKTSPLLLQFLSHPVIVELLTRAIGPNIKSMQSMLFIKSAGKPGQAWHQDEDFIPTRDRSLAGAWIAMDDAVIENGCLWVIPRSHRPGILWPMYPHDDDRYDCTHMSYDFPYRDEDAIPVEVPAGAIVFFNGYTLHKSEPNQFAKGFRRALVNHYMSAESLLPWQPDPDTAMARTDYRDIVMIAGEDPYAWKGTKDISQPHVRAAGEGGCGDGRVSLEAHREKLSAEKA